jgi:hypothetical protein
LVDSSEAVAQAILTRLWLFQGEWFLDATVGTPWLQQILGRHQQAAVPIPSGQNIYDVALKTVIANTLGVTGILTYSSHFDSAQRTLTVSAVVQTLFSASPAAISITIDERRQFVIGVSPLG